MHKFIESRCLILEDDATPLFSHKDELFNTIDQNILEFPQNDLLMLQKTSSWKNKKFSLIEEKKYFSLVKGNPFGSYGYVIKKSGANFINDIMMKLECPMDHLWNFFSDNLKLTISNKPLIGHPHISKADTYINRNWDHRGVYKA